MAKVKTRYKCRNCGYISASYLGRCPNCGAWNQFEEETQEVKKVSTKATASRLMTKIGNNDPVKLNEVKAEKEKRIVTPFEELNRVLGGRNSSRFFSFNWWRSWNWQINFDAPNYRCFS